MKRVVALWMFALLLLTACGGAGGEDASTSDRTASDTSAFAAESPSQEASAGESVGAAAASQTAAEPTRPTNADGTVTVVTTASTMPTTSTTPTAPAAPTAPTEAPTARQSVTVLIPEGYSFMQIAQTLENKGVCSKKAFYDAAQSYRVQSFTVPQSPDRCFQLEGYLFPDTYDFYIDDDPVNVLRKMLNNYKSKSGTPDDRILIIASIIQTEARTDKNMRLVSSVYHNRLASGMKLDSDPTREYVNKYITGNALVPEQAKYAPLYNTYKCAGLPAGPICSPGGRAIAAAQNPESTEYLYFFFGNDNDNHYAKTFDEHVALMNEYGVKFS